MSEWVNELVSEREGKIYFVSSLIPDDVMHISQSTLNKGESSVTSVYSDLGQVK